MSRALAWIAALVLAGCSSDAPAPAPPTIDVTGMEPAVAGRIEEARAAVERAPQDAGAWGRLAQVLHAHEELALATEVYRRARELDPGELRWTYGLFCAAYEHRLPVVELEELFAAAEELAPRHAPLHCRLGTARLRAGRSEEAVAAYRRAIDFDETLAAAHRGLGHALLALDEPEQALSHLARSVELRPRDSAAWAALARALRELGREADAREAAQRADSCQPTEHVPDPLRDEITRLSVSSAALLSYAEAALAAGDPERSAEYLAAALEARPEDPWAWRSLALALRRADRLDEAREAARRSIELAPDFAPAHLELGKICEVGAELDEAAVHYREVVSLESDDEAGWARLAATMLQLDRTEEALAIYAEADENAHLGPETLADWGVAWLQAGDPTSAITVFQRAVGLAPDHARARQGLERARAPR